MAKHDAVSMPADWNDHTSWDAYHRSQIARTKRDVWDYMTGSFPPKELSNFAADMIKQSQRSVWVPGCGLSPLAYLLAHFGLEVIATDVSPSAVAFQRDAGSAFSHLVAKNSEVVAGGSLTAEVHDFRQPFRHEAFDAIFNVKAFQGFSPVDMTTIAKVHAVALRPGRYGFFDTMNVQGERRDRLEQALEDAGFVVPWFGVSQWFRRTLRETGLPHVFILGQPMIPRTGEYAAGGPKWDSDMARLKAISTEYRTRMSAEQAAEQKRINPSAKVARVIYSTG
jgi:hypothetical protein